MKSTCLALAAALAAAALAADAAPTQAPTASAAGTGLPRGACFFTNDIRNHTIADARTLYIRTNREKVYRATMGHDCMAASLSHDTLIVRSFGVNQVCKPIDLNVSVRGGSRCIAQSIVQLTPAEVEAIPERIRP